MVNMEERPVLSNNEKVAMNIAGESTSRIMTLDGKTADDVIRERNVDKFNKQVDTYVEKLNEHAENLENYAKDLADKINEVEIMPIGNYLLVKQFEENPFQRIVKTSTGLILDLGGQRPQYKNTDNGEIEEEENIIKVGVIQQVGPEVKWAREGDTIFFTKMSAVPVPFYKQGLQLVNETRILAIVNEGLEKRFNEIKNGK
jgi:co-chaperonin GroES (HSP10)